eukprot:symbB.v1.2.026693.t1/scaffold2690.1/size72910/4
MAVVLPVKLSYDTTGFKFQESEGVPVMRMDLTWSLEIRLPDLVKSLAKFAKCDERPEQLSLVKELASSRHQEVNSTSTRRMVVEGEKLSKASSLSGAASPPTASTQAPLPPAPPPQPKAPKAPEFPRQTHPEYVARQRWEKKGLEKSDLFAVDLQAFRNVEFEPLPEPSRVRLTHANYKEVDWRRGEVPIPPLQDVEDREKENQEPEDGEKEAQEHRSTHVPPSRVHAHIDKCAQQ